MYEPVMFYLILINNNCELHLNDEFCFTTSLKCECCQSFRPG